MGVPDVSERLAEDCLRLALDQSRSMGFASELLYAAGRQAGKILSQVDHSPLGSVVQARDELFTGLAPNLLMVEPRSFVITGLYAATDRDAETWGCMLLLTQDRQVQIRGLANVFWPPSRGFMNRADISFVQMVV